MTREEIYQRCEREIDHTGGVLLEAGTGTGKSRIALELCKHIGRHYVEPMQVLILVAKSVHKQTWAQELHKWVAKDDPIMIAETQCYESLHKCTGSKRSYDVVILDECHHVQSDLRKLLLDKVRTRYMIGLSATIPGKLKHYLMDRYHLGLVQCSLQDAIEDGILPEPEIMLLPMQLDNKVKCEQIEVNPKAKGKVFHDDYEKLWEYKKERTHAILRSTKKQKLQYIDNQIVFAKRRHMIQRTRGTELRWLKLCGDRLKFLAECKNGLVKELLGEMQDKRVLTFCTSIAQTEELGKNNIHSKNKLADDVLEAFNEGKINHITACQVLNEGVNLKSCQYGVFANINASGIIKVQRVGRILRHEHPVVIIPYYVGTREEEIVQKWIEEYDGKLAHKYNTLKELINAIND